MFWVVSAQILSAPSDTERPRPPILYCLNRALHLAVMRTFATSDSWWDNWLILKPPARNALEYFMHHALDVAESEELSLPSPRFTSFNTHQLHTFSGPQRRWLQLFSIPLAPFSFGLVPIRLFVPTCNLDNSCQRHQWPPYYQIQQSVFTLFMYQVGHYWLAHPLWYIFFTVSGIALSLFYFSLVYWFLLTFLIINIGMPLIL